MNTEKKNIYITGLTYMMPIIRSTVNGIGVSFGKHRFAGNAPEGGVLGVAEGNKASICATTYFGT